MNVEAWFCEGCAEEQTEEPSYTERHKGYRGTVELWFCSRCTV